MEVFPSNSPAQRSQFLPKEGTPGAPPPPPEVKVRTMHSDLESMAKTGGGLPRFESVKVSGLSIEEEQGGASSLKSNKTLLAVVVVVVVVAVAAVGYFAYTTFFASSSGKPSSENSVVPPIASTTPTSSAPAQPTSTAQSAGGALSPELSVAHVSLFKKAPDQVISGTFPDIGAVQSATDLQSYSQKMASILAGINYSSTFVEVDAKFSDGNAISANGLFSEAGVQLIDPQVIGTDFNPDATFFVYRDKNGFWPGYVLALDQGQSWLSLKSDVQKIESAPGLGNLFLTNVGAASSTGFVDGTIASTTVRMVSFSGTSSQSQFVYGWSGNYLILSTSKDGFAQAIAHLQ